MPKSNIAQSALDAYAAYIKNDYAQWTKSDYAERIEINFEVGSSYIKVVKTFSGNHTSVHSFIVNKDGKFPKGAILKSASWKAPATNFVRAYIDKPEGWAGRIAWTGAH